uniref:Uncharacterized protein n=1 Tax=Amphimedon queenslandica TaxID=400682 RepID=A0A1X7TDI2_AMPQE
NCKKLKTDELEESVEEKQIMTGEYDKHKAIVADNELHVYITEVLKEKTQVEERLNEKQIIIDDFKTTVSEKDAYISKLLKEKSQQQERITSQEEQSIKETSSVEVQFNYLIPSMANLECLSDVQVAEKKLFLIQGDKPQLMNWEKYGLRIGVQEDSLLPSETVEAAVVALVGGQFQFPPNTVLVSAVYALSLSKPLLKPLQLEIQHCIDLRGRPDLGGYLKFAIAPMSTASLPYQFRLVEGGEFRSQYRLGWRSEHTTAVVGEVLYCWGGAREGLVGSHDSPTKRQTTSAIDAFNLLSGVWSSQPTRGQWTVPSVSGQCCPPTSGFTVEKINHNKGIMYGGAVHDGIATNSIYLFQLSHNTINWEYLKEGAIPNDGLWPKERCAHASTIINGVSTSPTLVVIGGYAREKRMLTLEKQLLETKTLLTKRKRDQEDSPHS